MMADGLVQAASLRGRFAAIEPQRYGYPALDPATIRRAMDEAVGPASGE
jgi:hypothetical protein